MPGEVRGYETRQGTMTTGVACVWSCCWWRWTAGLIIHQDNNTRRQSEQEWQEGEGRREYSWASADVLTPFSVRWYGIHLDRHNCLPDVLPVARHDDLLHTTLQSLSVSLTLFSSLLSLSLSLLRLSVCLFVRCVRDAFTSLTWMLQRIFRHTHAGMTT